MCCFSAGDQTSRPAHSHPHRGTRGVPALLPAMPAKRQGPHTRAAQHHVAARNGDRLRDDVGAWRQEDSNALHPLVLEAVVGALHKQHGRQCQRAVPSRRAHQQAQRRLRRCTRQLLSCGSACAAAHQAALCSPARAAIVCVDLVGSGCGLGQCRSDGGRVICNECKAMGAQGASRRNPVAAGAAPVQLRMPVLPSPLAPKSRTLNLTG